MPEHIQLTAKLIAKHVGLSVCMVHRATPCGTCAGTSSEPPELTSSRTCFGTSSGNLSGTCSGSSSGTCSGIQASQLGKKAFERYPPSIPEGDPKLTGKHNKPLEVEKHCFVANYEHVKTDIVKQVLVSLFAYGISVGWWVLPCCLFVCLLGCLLVFLCSVEPTRHYIYIIYRIVILINVLSGGSG